MSETWPTFEEIREAFRELERNPNAKPELVKIVCDQHDQHERIALLRTGLKLIASMPCRAEPLAWDMKETAQEILRRASLTEHTEA